MTRLIRIVLPLAAFTLITACANTARIQSDYHGDLEISQHKSFGLLGPAELESTDRANLLELYASAAVVQELRARGLVESDKPDILINVSAELEDVTRPPLENGICPSYEDYHSRWFNFEYGGTTGESRRPVCNYADGQFTVELLDAAGGQPIMKGVSRVRLDENDKDGRLLLSVSYDVATMFGESPVRDGSLPHSLAGR